MSLPTTKTIQIERLVAMRDFRTSFGCGGRRRRTVTFGPRPLGNDPTERGRDPITERDLRPIAAVVDWGKQRRMWKESVTRDHFIP